MKRAIFLLVFVMFWASICALAQEVQVSGVEVRAAGPVVNMAFAVKNSPVQGAPYSATVTDESVQTLSDGTRIVQNFSGTMARDSQGRTRQDAPLPKIGNLSVENAPHLAFISDPVAQVSYTLNLTDKTAEKMPMPPAGAAAGGQVVIGTGGAAVSGPMPVPQLPDKAEGDAIYLQQSGSVSIMAAPGPETAGLVVHKMVSASDSADTKTEDLGTQTMEGLTVSGTRVTHTIPAGQIGNDKPITITTEVWTSPDLKTIVNSKRSDPRMGDQTFQLTNISRAEPDASLFTVPSDFRIIEGPQKIVYGPNK